MDALTRLVLVDALYFKAPWDLAFDEKPTTRLPFHVADARSVQVDMMGSTDNASFVSGLHYRGARLLYAGQRLAMTVALPADDERAALAELLGDLPSRPGARVPVRCRCRAGPSARTRPDRTAEGARHDRGLRPCPGRLLGA